MIYKGLPRRAFLIIGCSFLIIGGASLINSFSGITGFVVLEKVDVGIGWVAGIWFVVAGLVLLMVGKRKVKASKLEKELAKLRHRVNESDRLVNNVYGSDLINDDGVLKRARKNAYKNSDIRKDVQHLQVELMKNNLEAGKGTPGHIQGTDIYYLRAEHGGRLYYHKIGKDYEIVGMSDKSRDQDSVIRRLGDLYGGKGSTKEILRIKHGEKWGSKYKEKKD